MIRLQHDKQKQMRYGTLQKRDTLTLCLLKLQLMEWRFDSAVIWFGETLPRMSEQLTDQVLVERVQKGDQKPLTYW